MSDTPEQNVQVDEAQAQVGGPDVTALQNELELLKANNRKLLSEKKNAVASVEDLQAQMSELQSNQQKAKQSQLAEAGEYKTLWQEQSGTVSSLQDEIAQLKQQLQDKDVAFQQQQIKATALNAISQSGVVNPEQAYALMQNSLRLKDEGVVALAGGVEVPLQQHLESLRAPGSGWEHHFSGSGARGMSAAGTTSTSVGGNSWESMSFSEKLALEVQDPQRFAQLKAQAGA